MEVKKTRKGLKVLVGLLTVLLLAAIGYIVADKFILNDKQENNATNEVVNKEEGTKKDTESNASLNSNKVSLVFSPSSEICDKCVHALMADGTTKEIIKNKYGVYKTYDMTDNRVYYIDNELFVHYVDLSNFKDTKLEIKVDNNIWDIYVDKNILIAFLISNNNFYMKQYNLDTKEVSDLSINSSGNSYFKDGIFYYQERNDEDLKSYNVNTKETTVIAKDSYLIVGINDYIIYEDDKDIDENNTNYNTYQYNTKTNKKTLIEPARPSGDVSHNLITISNDKVYYISNNTLYELSDKGSNAVHKFETDSSYNYDYDVLTLDNNYLLINEEKYKLAPEGFSKTEQTKKQYIININNNKIEKENNNGNNSIFGREGTVYR